MERLFFVWCVASRPGSTLPLFVRASLRKDNVKFNAIFRFHCGRWGKLLRFGVVFFGPTEGFERNKSVKVCILCIVLMIEVAGAKL